MIERILLAALFIAAVMLLSPPPCTHAHSSGPSFTEKIYMSRSCDHGYWGVEEVNQDDNSVTMRCEEAQ